MIVAYWILAVLLCVFYLYAGGKKLTQSRDRLRPMMGWVDDLPLGLTRTIGALEVLGAIGLVLPPLVGVLPRLAVAAAVGFALLQVAAATLHLSRGERQDVWLNVVLLVLAAAAAWTGTAV
ncbi:DoxX-like protein [Cellulomonas sp. PhB143]|nr:DoxX-like protein [Cellulomonas sp. PhB143]